MWQYLDDDERRRVRERVEEIGALATADAPFAHLRMEPERRAPDEERRFWVVLRSWSGGPDDGVERHLARSRGHGLPTDWM
jgi:hypothetical protein